MVLLHKSKIRRGGTSTTVRSARWSAVVTIAATLLLHAGCDNGPQQPLRPLPLVALDLAGEPVSQVWERPRAAPVSEVDEWRSEGYRPWKYVVVHHSGSKDGNAAELDRNHRARGFDELGYHFVITNGNGGEDGAVEVGRRWRIQKWGAHTGGTPGNEYNNYGIGICLVGEFSRSEPTPKQLASLRRLVAYLVGRYDLDPACVLGHRDAPASDTECPGRRLHGYIHSVLRRDLARSGALAGGRSDPTGQDR